jgi:hypothetical protein
MTTGEDPGPTVGGQAVLDGAAGGQPPGGGWWLAVLASRGVATRMPEADAVGAGVLIWSVQGERP